MRDWDWAVTLFFRLFFWFHTYGPVSEMWIKPEPLIQIVQSIWDQCGPALCVASPLSEGPFWGRCSELLSPASVTVNQDCVFNSANPVWSFLIWVLVSLPAVHCRTKQWKRAFIEAKCRTCVPKLEGKIALNTGLPHCKPLYWLDLITTWHDLVTWGNLVT